MRACVYVCVRASARACVSGVSYQLDFNVRSTRGHLKTEGKNNNNKKSKRCYGQCSVALKKSIVFFFLSLVLRLKVFLIYLSISPSLSVVI